MQRQVQQTPFLIRPDVPLISALPELQRLSQALSLKYAAHEVVREEELQAVGQLLWDALACRAAFDAAQGAAGAAILPVMIESSRADVQALPWETLYHPVQGFIGRHPAFTLSRRWAAPTPAAPTPDKGPL